MSEFGLKIKNIKAGTLFGYNQGVRNRYDYTEAMFSNSLFSNYIIQNGLNVWNDTSTRDIICLDFDFGSRSYEEEMDHLLKQFGPFEHDKSLSEESKERIRAIFRNVIDNKDNYMKCSKDEIREIFYENGVNVEYISSYTKKEGEKKTVKDKWDDLTDAQQAKISYDVAATRQTSKFKSMLDAFTDSMSLAEEATTANGNAEANQEKYMESTAGKLQAIKTQMQDFWVNFYNSGTVNGVLEFVHSLTEGFTSLEKTLGPIPALLTAVFAAMTVKNATMAGLKFLSGGGLATVVG